MRIGLGSRLPPLKISGPSPAPPACGRNDEDRRLFKRTRSQKWFPTAPPFFWIRIHAGTLALNGKAVASRASVLKSKP